MSTERLQGIASGILIALVILAAGIVLGELYRRGRGGGPALEVVRPSPRPSTPAAGERELEGIWQRPPAG